MRLSYRTKLLLRRILGITATVLAVAVLVTVCGLLWLQRFVVYTDDGAKLVFDQPKKLPQAQQPQSMDDPAVTIHFSDQPFREGLPQVFGYYIDPQDLMDDPEAVRRKLEQLPAGTAVLLDVKGYRGYFYYSTAVGRNTSSSYDIDKMDELIRWLAGSDLYVMARMSALRDFDLAWNDSSCGLAKPNGALYADEGRYGLGYWLDPTDDTVLRYLTQVLRELRELGFDEVVLDNFRFPNTEKLAFQGDRSAALANAAQQLIAACVNENFAISFASNRADYLLPAEQGRLFLVDIDPEDAQAAWDTAQLEEKRLNLVFCAAVNDDRYEIENGILYPLP